MQYGWDWKYKGFTYTGTSLAGIRTSILLKELAACFDVAQGLPHAMRANHIFLTHGHLDHAGGLPYLLSMMAMNGKHPAVYMPESLIPPMKKIMALWNQIDEFEYPLNFLCGGPFEIGPRHRVHALPSYHRVDSQGYCVTEIRKKLAKKFAGANRETLIAARQKGEQIEDEEEIPLFSFSGDTRIEFLDHELVQKSQVLFLECTYLDQKKSVEHARSWGHIHIDEILPRLNELECERIGLIHISARYSLKQAEEILDARLPSDQRERVFLFRGR